jgi:asparagine synthetase B (glutamine-hydrolysing)
VALSGGLDSALVLALVRAAGARVPAYVLAPTMEGYGELDEARRTARALDAELVVVPADEDTFLGALPDALEAMEAPLYNLHPVAKLLLARALRRDGVDLVLSGDGADHVLRRDRSADYLPLTRDLFDAAGVLLRSPFLDARVVEHLLALPPDREKRCLRAVAARYAIPAPLVRGPKVGRLAPAMDVRPVVPEGAREALEDALGRALGEPRDAAEATRQGTLATLVHRAGAW